MKISLAPMQGYSDYVYRNAYKKTFTGIDKFYTPFIIQQPDGSIKTSHKREINYYTEDTQTLTPQFACSTVEEYLFFEEYFTERKFITMNWNMGCPFPMLLSKKRGSGLIAHSDIVDKILAKADFSKIKLSIKVRLGHLNNEELKAMIEVLNKYPIDEIIIHARIGIQKYKGNVDFDKFEEYYNLSNNKITFNGDILSSENVDYLKTRFSELDSIMIGRGILSNVFLPLEIKGIDKPDAQQAKLLLKEFHNNIMEEYIELMKGETQILSKLKPFWEYFALNFDNSKKIFKGIKKCVNLKKYSEAVRFAFQQDVNM